MKTVYNIIVCLLLMTTIQSLNAQTQNPEYILNSDSVFVANQNTTITSTITVLETTVNWSQLIENSTETTVFNINSFSGTWDEQTSIGQMTYQMDSDGFLASLTVTGTSSGLSAELTLIISDTQQEVYAFSINGITYQ